MSESILRSEKKHWRFSCLDVCKHHRAAITRCKFCGKRSYGPVQGAAKKVLTSDASCQTVEAIPAKSSACVQTSEEEEESEQSDCEIVKCVEAKTSGLQLVSASSASDICVKEESVAEQSKGESEPDLV